MQISAKRMQQLLALIQSGKLYLFYSWSVWEKLRADVLRMDHYECQMCKMQGKYRQASIVHHVKHLKDRPDLALSVYDPETNERQLVSVCKKCHEELHPESKRQFIQKNSPVTVERWD